jgi:hypothetical protein
LTLVFGLGVAYAQEGGADVQVKAAIAKAKNPTPPATASKKTTAGKGKTTVNTANTEGEDDSFWVESIDIDSDGTVEETDILYDDEDKVLFLYDDGDFKCQGGGIGEGELLIAVNTAGNPRGKPAYSRWKTSTYSTSSASRGRRTLRLPSRSMSTARQKRTASSAALF